MSIKEFVTLIMMCFVFGCSVPEQKNIQAEDASKKSELEPIVEEINVENINLNSTLFQKLKDPTGSEEYKFHSRLFLQTSLFNRHVNILGLATNPDITEHIRRASYSYKKAGEHQKAMHLLQLSIDEEVNIPKRLNNLDYAAWNYLYFYRDYKNTIATVNEILRLTSNDLSMSCHGEPCLLLKGQALYRLGKYEEAVSVFTAFQNTEEAQGFNAMDNSLVVFYKARALAELEQNEEASLYFMHLLKNNPHAEAAYQLAKIHLKRKELPEAEQLLIAAKNAISKGYNFKEPYFERFDKVFPYQIDEMRMKISKS